jgi:hypothetical protein
VAAGELTTATVVGPDLSVADAYATALYAAGPAGLDWFPTPEGYRALVLDPALSARVHAAAEWDGDAATRESTGPRDLGMIAGAR